MALIYYPGLNCHLAALVNLSARLGLPYEQAYSALWSESDFVYEADHDIYTSRRVHAHLADLGLRRAAYPCGPDASPAPLRAGTLLLVGMDAFHIPWHPVGMHFHSTHYFFAQISEADTALCSDPVYGAVDVPMAVSALVSASFELQRVYRVPAEPPPIHPAQEANRVLAGHPALLAGLLDELRACETRHDAVRPLIRQVTAMSNNRHLFARYLEGLPTGAEGTPNFSHAFLNRWEGVKGGLYKVTIVREKGPVIEAVATLLTDLLEEEQAMARRLAAACGP